MCDYSLHNVATRPAAVGDKLITTRFLNSVTRGFAPAGGGEIAVCLRPGTELAFEQEIECEAGYGLLPNRKTGHQIATFRQVNRGLLDAHHDALELPDGQIVLVTKLVEGQRAGVLQLPAEPRIENERPMERAEPVRETIEV